MTQASGLEPAQLRDLIALVLAESGVVLSEDQRSTIESRLVSLCRTENDLSLETVVRRCSQGDRQFIRKVVSALTNGETSFFRDAGVFAALEQEVLPRLLAARAGEKVFRCWSAACSTGQEAYGLAMLLAEKQLWDWQVGVLATDIAESRLQFARVGSYGIAEVNRGLPASRLVRHFEPSGDRYRVKDSVRDLVDFRLLNLLGPWPEATRRMDVICLRNATIYWSRERRLAVFERVRERMVSGGVLVLGSSESPLEFGGELGLRPTGLPGIYELKE